MSPALAGVHCGWRIERDTRSDDVAALVTGRTLFVSIHQLNDAAKVCDRLVLLNAGKRVAEGTLGELQTQANLKDGGLEEIFLALT